MRLVIQNEDDVCPYPEILEPQDNLEYILQMHPDSIAFTFCARNMIWEEKAKYTAVIENS